MLLIQIIADSLSYSEATIPLKKIRKASQLLKRRNTEDLDMLLFFQTYFQRCIIS